MKYRISLSLECDYEVEADSFDSALEQADEWFSECTPDIVEWEVLPEDAEKIS